MTTCMLYSICYLYDKVVLVKLNVSIRSQGVRVFVFFYIFSAFILTQGYKASMMSALTIPIVPKPLGGCDHFWHKSA